MRDIWFASFLSFLAVTVALYGCGATAKAHLVADLHTIEKDAIVIEQAVATDLAKVCADLPKATAGLAKLETLLPAANAEVVSAETVAAVVLAGASKVCAAVGPYLPVLQ